MDIAIVSQECYLCSFIRHSCKLLILYHAFQCGAGQGEIAAVNSWFWYIKGKQEGGRHRRSVHVLMIGDKVDGAYAELCSLIMVCSIALLIDCGIIIILCLIDITTECTHPSMPLVNPFDKWIDICTTIFTAYNRIILEWHRRNFLTLWSKQKYMIRKNQLIKWSKYCNKACSTLLHELRKLTLGRSP